MPSSPREISTENLLELEELAAPDSASETASDADSIRALMPFETDTPRTRTRRQAEARSSGAPIESIQQYFIAHHRSTPRLADYAQKTHAWEIEERTQPLARANSCPGIYSHAADATKQVSMRAFEGALRSLHTYTRAPRKVET